jgi:hypothetical protein
MELPDFKYEDLPEDMKEKLGPGEFVIEPLTPQDNYEPKEYDAGRDAYTNRKIIRTLDEYASLQKIYADKKTNKKQKWKKVKAVSRYYKSALYAIKDLDRDPTTYYNNDSPEGEILNNSEE